MRDIRPTDLTRAWDGLRRRWWIVLLATLAGVLLGVVSAPKSQGTTFEAVVPTPSIDSTDLIDQVMPVRPNLDELLADLQSEATKKRLGSTLDGSAVTGVVATDKSSVTLRISGPNPDTAQAAAKAYADELAKTYYEGIKTSADQTVAALDAALALLKSQPAPSAGMIVDPSDRLSHWTLQRAVIVNGMAGLNTKPTIRQISAAGSSLSTSLLLAMVAAALAVVAIGFAATRDRKLRYAADIEEVLGAGTLLSVVSSAEPTWALRAMLTHLAESGPVTLVPVSAGSEGAAKNLQEAAPQGHTPVVLPPVTSSQSVSLPSGKAVVVALLGEDTRSDLADTHRWLTAAGADIAGVVVSG